MPFSRSTTAHSLSDRFSYGRQLAMHTPRILDGEGRTVKPKSVLRHPSSYPAAAMPCSPHKANSLPRRYAPKRSIRWSNDVLTTTASHTMFHAPSDMSDSEGATSAPEMPHSSSSPRHFMSSFHHRKAPSIAPRSLNQQIVRCPHIEWSYAWSQSRIYQHKWSADLRCFVNESRRQGVSSHHCSLACMFFVALFVVTCREVVFRSSTDAQQPPQTSRRTIDDVFSRAEYRIWSEGIGGNQEFFDRDIEQRSSFEGPSTSAAVAAVDPMITSTPWSEGIYSRSMRGKTTNVDRSRGGLRTRSSSLPPHGILEQRRHLGAFPYNLEERLLSSSNYPIDISPLPQRRFPLQMSKASPFSLSHMTTANEGAAGSASGDLQSTVPSSSFVSPLTGLLIVQIFEGTGLRVGSEKDELYCVIEIDYEHRARTEVKDLASKFQWRESFEIDVFECRIVDFYVYSWHPQFRHKLRHRGTLHLLDAALLRNLDNRTQSIVLDLEPRGHLIIRVGFLSLLLMYRRQLALKQTAYWGSRSASQRTGIARSSFGETVLNLLRIVGKTLGFEYGRSIFEEVIGLRAN
ncbi:unnamed protein product [Soboliphyme baturini]|uniref:C2 domain-containing protein n=1 Tax=Soboliphyme baturini TaxID=241478 RepID=A0A183J7K6_9BILA|nr:unnamed protein product [Soboliphyme baturini]